MRDRIIPGSEGSSLGGAEPGRTSTVRDNAATMPPLDPGTPPTVTPRQLQVAALVAQGWSNRQIADELVVTERSAESHVEQIRARLGFRSRAQVAAWYVATNPSPDS